MIRLPLVLATVLLTASAGGCAVLPGDGTYPMTVYFAKTPALYEKSRVKVMGADVGGIERIRVEERRVRVDLRIREDVPIARDARATIVAASTIGERSVVLHPAWRQGLPRAPSGMVVPQERTDLPVEIDEALTAFANLAESIDPAALQEALAGGARAVDGRGDDVNRALQSTGTLAGNLAAQDQKLAGLARDLNRLATSVNRRDEKLTALIGNLSVAGRALSDERGRLKTFLGTLEALIRQGGTLVSVYREKLPATLTEASELVMTLKANSASLAQGIGRLADSIDEVWSAWDRKTGSITVRISLDNTIRTWLEPIFDAMGWGSVPCLDRKANDGCQRTLERGRP
ncbi:MCE family protein [Actinomadura sp. 9N407]|uniref:MCE family protein n=1 Tax=Actinomadura sp. 9N407 TaxID=3375154 RepID=UPI00378A7B42